MSEPLDKLSFSLAGCGFLGIFHIGMAACLREHVPHLLKEDVKFAGASAGALIAACLICDVSLNHCIDFTLRLAKSSRAHPLGGWEPAVDIAGILRASIEYVLPADAHILCTNRLYVSCSGISDEVLHANTKVLENVLISEFETRKDLIDVLMCSAFIPGFSAYGLPSYKGRYLFDGGLTDNLPMLHNNTITVSPWAGEHSICPRDLSGHTFPMTVVNTSICPTDSNLVRFKDAFNPPPPELLKGYCWQGYDACLQFLSEHELIRCNNHRVLTHLVLVDQPRDSNCHDCRHQLEHAAHSGLSPDLLEQLSREEDEALSRGLGTLVATPVKAAINFMAIPVVMLKDLGMQLYLAAYFGAKSGNYLEKCAELVERISNPRILIYNLITYLLSKAVFTGLEYLARVLSITLKASSDITTSTKNIMKGTCMCVQRAGTATVDGMCLLCSLPIRIASHLSGRSQTKQSGSTLTVEQQRETTQQTTESKVKVEPHQAVEAKPCEPTPVEESGIAVASEHGETAELSKEPGVTVVDAGQDNDNIVVDIDQQVEDSEQVGPSDDEEVAVDKGQCEPLIDSGHISVVMEIETKLLDVDSDQDDRKTEASADEAGNVAGVGPIDKVHFDSFTFAQKDEEVVEHREPRSKVLHEYVHKFEQYRPIMTMHYVDEQNVQHTESLFADDSPQDISHPQGLPEIVVESDVSEKQRTKHEGERNDQPFHDVNTELKHLLEEKVLQPQREFEKEHMQAQRKGHQKKRLSTETGGSQSRHFRLQVVSFIEELPSPNLSRSNSIKNVSCSEDESSECHLVRSTSDASKLTGRLKELQKRNMETREQRYRQTKDRKEMGSGNLAASKVYSSMQTLATSLPAMNKSMSDTSLISRNLKMMKMAHAVDGSITKSEKIRQPQSRAKRRKIASTVVNTFTTSSDSSDMFHRSCSAPSLSKVKSSYQIIAGKVLTAACSVNNCSSCTCRDTGEKNSVGHQLTGVTKGECLPSAADREVGSKQNSTAASRASGKEHPLAALKKTDKSSYETRMPEKVMPEKVTRKEDKASASSLHTANHLVKCHSVLRDKEEADNLRLTLQAMKLDERQSN